MDDYFKEAEARRAAEKQRDALDYIKRRRQREDDQNALIATIDAIKENAGKTEADTPSSMRARTAKHTHILDGLFDHYVD